MKYALIDNVRSCPTPKDKGKCPVCGSEVISKCGQKIIWHWAHKPSKHCDPWWENETEWHRSWKNKYPEEWQEIVHFDLSTGEKHIADIKTNTELVIEFQNSPMPSEELKQREEFYKKIIWVINGEKFKKSFYILHSLPDPNSHMAEDIVFYPIKHNHKGKIFYRKSENPGNLKMVRIHAICEIQDQIDKEYMGHHLYDWVRPRTVWYESTENVYIDFGDELLWNLQIYDDRGLQCIQAVSKAQFINETGGTQS